MKLKNGDSSYQSGEIDFFSYIQSMEKTGLIYPVYLEIYNAYNQDGIAINFITYK